MDNPDTTAIMTLPPMAVLARKMACVMGQLKRLNQNGQNTQGWTFTSIDDITDAIRALMAEFGIALFSRMLRASEVKDGKTTRATVDMEFELVCADTGVSKVMSWTGSAEDYSDKALNKAAVYAEKFWLKSTFLVSTGKDPDKTSPRIDKPQQQRAPEQRQQTVPQKPAPEPAPVAIPPKYAHECFEDATCRKEFTSFRKKLGITDDKPYLAALGEQWDMPALNRYSEYPGKMNELYSNMEAIHERLNAPADDTPEPDPVVQAVSAAIPVEDVRAALNGKPGRIDTKPQVATPFTSDNTAEQIEAERKRRDLELHEEAQQIAANMKPGTNTTTRGMANYQAEQQQKRVDLSNDEMDAAFDRVTALD